MIMAPKIGRNEPCPCGSGKKYKKCCGREAAAAASLFPEEERTGTPMDAYFGLLPVLGITEQRIIRFGEDGRELKKARNSYERRYHPGRDDGILDSHYVSWLNFDLRFGPSRKTIVERVIEDPLMARLGEPGPTCLKNMAASYATFYEVINPGPEVVILEELGTGRRWNVMYYHDLFDTPAEKGEVWYTRLLGPPEKALSYTTPYVWGPETRAQFERGVRSLAKDFIKNKLSIGVPADRLFAESQKETALFWTEYIRVSNSPSGEKLTSVPSEWPTLGLPHIINNDREDFVFTEMDFKVKDEQQARRKLAALKSFEYDEKDDSWTWLKARSRVSPDEPRTVLGTFRFKEGRLVAETNSRERALRLEDKLMGHLRGLLRLEKTTYRQPDDLMSVPPEEMEAARKESEDLNARPEVREALRKYHEDYYFEKWPRQRVPMLGNVTPLQAAKTERGRQKLIELLEYYDRMQDAQPADEPRVDFDRLRRLLGLPSRAS
jgi:hypothetical protein